MKKGNYLFVVTWEDENCGNGWDFKTFKIKKADISHADRRAGVFNGKAKVNGYYIDIMGDPSPVGSARDLRG